MVDNSTHLASSMVVPDGHHGVLAVLLHGGGVIRMLGDEVDREVDGHVHQLSNREVWVSELLKGFGLYYSGYGVQSIDTPFQILGLLEVVESHYWVAVGVSVSQLEASCGERAEDLLQDEAAPEVGVLQLLHGFHSPGYGFRRSLLRWDCAQLSRLQELKLARYKCTFSPQE